MTRDEIERKAPAEHHAMLQAGIARATVFRYALGPRLDQRDRIRPGSPRPRRRWNYAGD